MMAGTLTSSGGELGTFTFAPDGCVVRPDLDAVDLSDSKQPAIVMRIVHPQSADFAVVVANTDAPGGAREVPLTRGATCMMHKGYHAVLYGDRGLGVRLDCATPAGGRISGTAAAGVCR
jgi:hypothetical protein